MQTEFAKVTLVCALNRHSGIPQGRSQRELFAHGGHQTDRITERVSLPCGPASSASSARQIQWRPCAASRCSARRARASLASSSAASATISDSGLGIDACRLSLAPIPAAASWGLFAVPASSKMRREDISVHSLGPPNRLRVRPSSVLAHRRRPQSGSGSPPEQKHHRRIHSGSEPAKRSNGKLNDRMVNSGLAHRPSQAFRPGPLEKQKAPFLRRGP